MQKNIRSKPTKKYSEKVVDKYAKLAIEKSGALTFKNHPMTNAGIPDRIVHRNQITFYLELKTTGEKCTPLQIEFHKMLKEKGIDTYVLDTKIDDIYDIYVFGYTTYESRHYYKNPHKDK